MKSAYTYDRENKVKKSMIKAPVTFAVFLPTPEAFVTDIMYNYVF